MMCDRKVHIRNKNINKNWHFLWPGCQDSRVIWQITVMGTIKTGGSIAIQLILTLWEVTNVSVTVSDNRQMRALCSV